jgi:hypothetical protein
MSPHRKISLKVIAAPATGPVVSAPPVLNKNLPQPDTVQTVAHRDRSASLNHRQLAFQSLYSCVVVSDAFRAFAVNQPRLRFSRSSLIASRRPAVPRCTLASSKPIV